MKKLVLLAILFCLGTMSFAQKVYFIYIQSEAGMPFYVKLGDKLYSSTASGYLILSNLKDSTYSFYLGQPGNQSKELRFSVNLNNTDRGFLLKNFQNGWALFDLQSMAIINPSASTSGVMYDSNEVKRDLFTRLLATAVDDSTLLMEPVLTRKEEIVQPAVMPVSEPVAKASDEIAPKKEEVISKQEEGASKKEEVAPKQDVVVTTPEPQSNTVPVPDSVNIKANETVAKDSVSMAMVKDTAVKNSPQAKSDQLENNIAEQVEYKRSVVKKYAEGSNVEGFMLTYIDTWQGTTDTIRLMIPNVVYPSAIVIKDQPSENKQFLGFTNDKDSLKAVPEKSSLDTLSNCKQIASDSDFSALRKSMAAKSRGVDMLTEAQKAFNERCFTTEQIRNLGTLFLTQEGKFQFFKEAKPHISDKDRFSTLLFELKEDAYMERFKALLENKPL